MNEDLLLRTYEARESYLGRMGSVNPLVLAPLMNPTFLGGPRWPALRQAWRVVNDGRRTAIVSDGLSDPFDDRDEQNTGLGLEFVGETEDPLPDPIHQGWLFHIVYEVSQQAAEHGGFSELLDELG